MTDRANVTIKPKISQKEKREMPYQAIVIILLFALIGVVLLSLCTGRYYIHIKEVLNIFISISIFLSFVGVAYAIKILS